MARKVKVKIKVGDLVELIAGRDKGRSGKVKKIIFKENNRVFVLVERCNMVKKHVRANPDQNKPGGIVKQEAPIDISNVKKLEEAAAA